MMLMTDNRAQPWMLALGLHYQRMRRCYREETLLIAFDIDGTVVDPRPTLIHLLREFDALHRTALFRNIGVEQVDCCEWDIERQLMIWGVPETFVKRIVHYCFARRFDPQVLQETQRAYPQAMEVIAHFAALPGTAVGFNTGRGEELRELTLDTLNRLGVRSGVTFSDGLLKMNTRSLSDIGRAKREVLDEYRRAGYRVIAMIDNEPGNLDAMAGYDDDLLLLCARTSSGCFSMGPSPWISGHRWCVRSLRFGLLTGAQPQGASSDV